MLISGLKPLYPRSASGVHELYKKVGEKETWQQTWMISQMFPKTFCMK